MEEIYTRMEIKMEVYQVEGTGKGVVVLFNDKIPDELIILRDEKAMKFVNDMMNLIDMSR